jgi:hypothetical protein
MKPFQLDSCKIPSRGGKVSFKNLASKGQATSQVHGVASVEAQSQAHDQAHQEEKVYPALWG